MQVHKGEFETITETALRLDLKAVKQLHLLVTICLGICSSEYSSPAECLAAKEGFKPFELMRLGLTANINEITLDQYRKLAEFLLLHKSDINWLARGAAMRLGDRELTEVLRRLGADINGIAKAAAMGGQREYAEFLRANGANIQFLANGAKFGGQDDYDKFLRKQGANSPGGVSWWGRKVLLHLHHLKANFGFSTHQALAFREALIQAGDNAKRAAL